MPSVDVKLTSYSDTVISPRKVAIYTYSEKRRNYPETADSNIYNVYPETTNCNTHTDFGIKISSNNILCGLHFYSLD